MALFWSRALIGRLQVTTLSRAAGRGRGRKEGHFRQPRGLAEWAWFPWELFSPEPRAQTVSGVVWAPHAHPAICWLGDTLMRACMRLERAAKNHTRFCGGVAGWHYTSYKPHGGSTRALPDAG